MHRGPGAHPRRPARGRGRGLDVDLRLLATATWTSTRTTGAERDTMKLWGGNYSGGSRPGVLGVQPLVPVRPAPAARGDRGLARLRARAGPLRRAARGRRRSAGRRPGAGAGASRRPTRRTSTSTRRTSTASSRRGWARSWATWPARATSGRSRNEQAVTALRLWIRGAIDRLRARHGRRWSQALVRPGRGAAPTRSCPATRTRARRSRSPSATSRPPTPGRLVRDRERLRRRAPARQRAAARARARWPAPRCRSTARRWPATWASRPSPRTRSTR